MHVFLANFVPETSDWITWDGIQDAYGFCVCCRGTGADMLLKHPDSFLIFTQTTESLLLNSLLEHYGL